MKLPSPRAGRITNQAASILLVVIAGALLAQNFVLLRQNRRLKLGLATPVASADSVPVGSILRRLSGVGLNGQYRPIALPQDPLHPLLLITFATGCPICDRNQHSVQAAVQAARSRGWRVLWVSRDPLDLVRGWCKQYHVNPNSVVTETPAETYIQLGLRVVPKLIAVGSFGHVERVWPGEFGQAQLGDLIRFMGERSAQFRAAGPGEQGSGNPRWR